MTYCTSTTAGGLPCEAPSLPGGEFCTFHEPKRSEANRKAREAGGRARKQRVAPPESSELKLDAERDVLEILKDAIHKVRIGVFDPKVGNAVGYLCGVALSVFKQTGTDKKLDELDARTRPLKDMTFEQMLALTKTTGAENGDSQSPDH